MTKGKMTEKLDSLKTGLQEVMNQISAKQKEIEQLVANKIATEGAIQMMDALLKEEGDEEPIAENEIPFDNR
jgi:hypothetical protein